MRDFIVAHPKMDPRTQALIESGDWLYPPNADPLGPPMMSDRMVKQELPPEYKENQEEIEHKIKAYFSENIDVAIEAIRKAICWFKVEGELDFDRRAEIRDQRGLKRQRKQLESLSKTLKLASDQLAAIGDDGRDRLTRGLGPSFRIDKGDFMALEDLLPVAHGAARNAAWLLTNIPEPKSRRQQGIVRRRLVYRLKLIWETFTNQDLHQRRLPNGEAGDWPFADFVSLISTAVTGKSSERYVRDLIYPSH